MSKVSMSLNVPACGRLGLFLEGKNVLPNPAAPRVVWSFHARGGGVSGGRSAAPRVGIAASISPALVRPLPITTTRCPPGSGVSAAACVHVRVS